MFSHCQRYIRIVSRRCCGPIGHLKLKMVTLRTNLPCELAKLFGSYVVNSWKLLAYCILPLLLIFYEYKAAYLLFFVVLSLAGVIYFGQDMMLFHADYPPNSRLFVKGKEGQSRLPPGGLESVSFLTEDLIILHAYLLKAEPSIACNIPTIINFHGNAGNIGHRIPNAVEMVTKLGCNVLLVEYRGFGKSTGTPSESGLYLDAKAAINFVKEKTDLNPTKVILFGRSLGGAVAIHSAFMAGFSGHSQDLAMLVVENTFTRIADMAGALFHIPGFNCLPRVFYKNKFASCEKIGQVHMPSLFISGQADQLVPPHMMASLFSKCPASKKRLLKIEGGTHNETWMAAGYYESVKKFIDEVFGEDSKSAPLEVGQPKVSNDADTIFPPRRSFASTALHNDDTGQGESNIKRV